jgi:hypothetical protein
LKRELKAPFFNARKSSTE